MKKRAVVVHLDEIEGITPLVGGYLAAFALADPAVRDDWDVELYSERRSVSASRVLRHLVNRSPDVVAFSVYTWNAGLVKRLVPALRGLLPRAHLILGGVEVMHVAHRYLDPTWDDVSVCNGEGERSFRGLLLELGSERPDLERVGGITFPRDGAWCTTPGIPRIENMGELPSPWLTGVFDDGPGWQVALFETNRGCPFACEFCFWGGATGQKVYQQDLERLKDELTYIGKRGIRAISFCDANFGIFPRDVELARHLVDVAARYRGPARIVFNSSKVRPDRVEEISRIFADAELLTRHVFSLQSMNERALRVAKRTSLEREPYRRIQRRLNEQRMSSVIELLWPMPGETLDSFRDGVDELCRLGAQGFLIYPLVWLNNTGYEERTEEHGVTTLPEDDPASGGRIVVQTNDVPFGDYVEGLRFWLSVHLLHDCRGLYATTQLLDALGVARFRDVFDAFGRWVSASGTGPVAELCGDLLERFEDLAKYSVRGLLVDAALVAHRKEFDRLLVEFVAAHPAWTGGEHGALIREALEYDLLTRPYVFLQTPFELGVETEHVETVETQPRLRRVRASYDFPRLVGALRVGAPLDPADLVPGSHALRIDHKRFQLFQLPRKTEEEYRWQCMLAVQEIARIEPTCSAEPAYGTASVG